MGLDGCRWGRSLLTYTGLARAVEAIPTLADVGPDLVLTGGRQGAGVDVTVTLVDV